MEKKKISLLKVLLIIVIIIMVAGGVIYVYKTTTPDNNNNTSKNNVENNIIEDNTVENNTENDEDTESNDLSDEKAEILAKETLDKYVELDLYNFEDSSVGPFPQILINLGLETSENIDKLYDSYTDPSKYIKSNVKYEDFKEEMLKYVTEEYFLKNYSNYKNMDGYVGICVVAAGLPIIEIESVDLVSKDKNEYIFSVIIKDVEIYDHYIAGETAEDIEYLSERTIKFENVDNYLVISEFLFDEILIDGVFAVDASDVSYEFKSDGTVRYVTNLSETKGTYETTGDSEVEITFKTITIWDEETNEKITRNEERTETVIVLDDKILNIIGEADGEQYSFEIINVTHE